MVTGSVTLALAATIATAGAPPKPGPHALAVVRFQLLANGVVRLRALL
jgi:hypothetical protein